MIDFSDVKSAERVFHHFIEISKIPRPSGVTVHIADFLENFAKSHSLEYIRDGFDNIIIKKPASRGYENRPTVILQGHSDIVAEKSANSFKDMSREGVDVFRDGDFLGARETTLGGDDGIALAYALAILEDKNALHPALEAVFTTDEETGLTGASGLDASVLSGKILINIDSEDEGVFTVGCAGGVRADIKLKCTKELADGEACEISVSGLTGGHSGVEIDKGRLSAIKLLAEILAALPEVKIGEIHGGSKDNAIPRCASVTVKEACAPVEALLSALGDKYRAVEPDIQISLKKLGKKQHFFDGDSSAKIVKALTDLPFGVIKMSEDIEGLPETSMNIGIVSTDGTDVCIASSIRSSKAEQKRAVLESVAVLAKSLGAEFSAHGDYPGWEFKKDSLIRAAMCEIYEKIYGKRPCVVTIHAGLECGIFADKIEGLDAISIGPDMKDIHTTEERLSVSSSARVFDFLCEVLKNI